MDLQTVVRPRARVALLLFAALLVTATPGFALTFADGDFAPTDWSDTIALTTNPAITVSTTLRTSGGNPGNYRENSHDNFASGEFIFTDHLYLAGSYDPGTDGAISDIDFSVDLAHLTAGATAWQLLLVQNGVSFYTIPYGGFSGATFQTSTLLDLTAADFDTNVNVGVNSPGSVPTGIQPDFSASGAPIQFGYTLGNTCIGAGVCGPTQVGVDNWSVTVNPVPEPAAGALLALAGCAVLVQRARRASA